MYIESKRRKEVNAQIHSPLPKAHARTEHAPRRVKHRVQLAFGRGAGLNHPAFQRPMAHDSLGTGREVKRQLDRVEGNGVVLVGVDDLQANVRVLYIYGVDGWWVVAEQGQPLVVRVTTHRSIQGWPSSPPTQTKERIPPYPAHPPTAPNPTHPTRIRTTLTLSIPFSFKELMEVVVAWISGLLG